MTKFRMSAAQPMSRPPMAVFFLPNIFTSFGMSRMPITEQPIMMPLTTGCNPMWPRLYWQKKIIIWLFVFMAEIVNKVIKIMHNNGLLVNTILM